MSIFKALRGQGRTTRLVQLAVKCLAKGVPFVVVAQTAADENRILALIQQAAKKFAEESKVELDLNGVRFIPPRSIDWVQMIVPGQPEETVILADNHVIETRFARLLNAYSMLHDGHEDAAAVEAKAEETKASE